MAFEPNNFTKEHILKAAGKIKTENITIIPSTKWDIEIFGIKYPPKELMRYAHEQIELAMKNGKLRKVTNINPGMEFPFKGDGIEIVNLKDVSELV